LIALATCNAYVLRYDGIDFTHPLIRTLPLTYTTFLRTLPETQFTYDTLPRISTLHYEPTYALKKEPATYRAETKGSLHIAPLEGHEISQTSLNLA
jgi:hypothetical protein